MAEKDLKAGALKSFPWEKRAIRESQTRECLHELSGCGFAVMEVCSSLMKQVLNIAVWFPMSWMITCVHAQCQNLSSESFEADLAHKPGHFHITFRKKKKQT